MTISKKIWSFFVYVVYSFGEEIIILGTISISLKGIIEPIKKKRFTFKR